MLIDIDRIPKQGLRIDRDFEFLSEDLVEEDAVFLNPVHADISVQRSGEEIYIKGRITSCLSFVCSRCLAPYRFPIDSKFDLVYLPEELEMSRDQLEPEDMDTALYLTLMIDLKEVVLEQLNLTFPLKPLCSEECQGICPVCGKVIDQGACSCLADDSDPRLDKLKNFLKDKR